MFRPVRARDVTRHHRMGWTPDERLVVVWVGILGGVAALFLIYGMVVTS
jgi:hypothetical protein